MTSPKKSILEFLKNVYPEWRSGASLESYNFGGKPSTTGRALRRLQNEGKIEHDYRLLEKRNDKQVYYRYIPTSYKYAEVMNQRPQLKLSL